jgi:stearoyl-CoA desaturase (delta-9 desaturase)
VAVTVPFIGLIAAICCSWGWAFTWVDLVLLMGMYSATGLGITAGYHRLFAHRSFETTRPIKAVLAVLGSMSLQGSPIKWVAIHRRHHQHSDEIQDPHSPRRFGRGACGVIAGFWHAHIGWMFTSNHPDLLRYARDLQADRLISVISRLGGIWVLLGLLIPTVLGWIIAGQWTGALLGFLWGGLVRIFLVHHVTFSVNSICHIWGRKRFKLRDESRNNFLVGLLAFGEGWHNNHHAFPTSAKHGLRWWEPDLSYAVIYVLELLGLAWRVRVPQPEALLAKSL